MLKLTRRDLGSNRIVLSDFQHKPPRRCPSCGAIDAWMFPGCRECGSHETPDFICTCGGLFDSREEFEYTAIGEGTTKITKLFFADKCSSCGKLLFPAWFANELDDFARSVPPDFGIIPEVGICTRELLEVLIDAFYPEDSSIPEITRRSQGIRIRLGAASRLFARSLDHVTDYDTADFGHELSPTLRIRPGPPYKDNQRKTIHVLLARIRRVLGAPVRFWSVHFKASDEEHQRVIAELLEAVEMWPLDRSREALALANGIANRDEPGLFINTFRLLELVLERLLDRDILKKRRDSSVRSQDFLVLARTHTSDLKTKLRRRVESLPSHPDALLRALWRVMCPGRGYNPNEIYERIASFRNMHVHQPRKIGEPLALPWEIPNYELFARLMLSLLVEFIKA
jgi:hypothetical protein